MPNSHLPVGSNESDLSSRTGELARFLYRPIVFSEPERVVAPPSWLEHIPFAFWIVDVLRPATFVELGTHSGNSYAAFAQAIRMLGLPTAAYAVDTWRGDSQAGFYDEGVFTEFASFHDRHFSAFSRLVRSTFEEAAEHFADGSVDLLHLDGCHTYEAASADLAVWRPKLSRRGVVLLHDVNVRERDFGAWRLWQELQAGAPSFEFLHGHGLGVLGLGVDLPDELRWLFSRTDEGDATVHAVRQFFARLGGAISARHGASEIAASLQAEFARKEAAQAEATRAAIEEHDERTRAALSARDARIAEHTAALARLTGELTSTRTQLARATREAAESADSLQRVEAECSRLRATLRDELRRLVTLQQRLAVAQRPRPATIAGDRAIVAGPATRVAQALQSRHQAVVRNVLSTLGALGALPTRRRRTIHRSGIRALVEPALMRRARAVMATGLFDEAYYRGRNPDVVRSGMTPLVHYLLEGASEGRSPHPLFDGAYYLRRNPDVAAARLNPLLHYRETGAFEGRNPHPLFDVTYYLGANPDVRAAGTEPLGHFLTSGAAEGRNPNPLFDVDYYLRQNPDVAAAGTNPLIHFAVDGWREGRRPSPGFDPQYYLATYPDARRSGENPLAHFLEHGHLEGRRPRAEAEEDEAVADAPAVEPVIVLTVGSGGPLRIEPPTVVVLSHVMPMPPRAGNEYRIYRMLRWLRRCGYRVVPMIAPLPGERVAADALQTLAAEFSNAVICHRDGRLDYILTEVPDVLRSLADEPALPVSILLDERDDGRPHQRDLLQMDRTFCHDALITAALRLQQVLGPHVLLAEYIWMTRILPLVSGQVLKVVDTIDVFSTKQDKVLRFGIDDLHVDKTEEAERLRQADLILAIQEDEQQQLQQLLPEKPVITVGVDFDVVADGGDPAARQILYVASDNPMNRKGLADFLRFAWPHIRQQVPDATLRLVGRIGDTLISDVPGVERLGKVDDLTPLYREARLVINPAVAGTGLKIKTLEALGHLRPIVTWPSGTDGVAPEVAALCETVHDWYEFARRVTALLVSERPFVFSPAQVAVLMRRTAPATVYAGLTDTVAALMQDRFGVHWTHAEPPTPVKDPHAIEP